MNPFRETIVSDPWRAPGADVPEIHADVFDECLRGIGHVRRAGRSAALLIHGGAGSGKTHLLSRLRNRLTLQMPTDTNRDECLFVWVRLQASPRMIWRHVRRTLVEDWFRPVRGQRTQFERVLFRRLAEVRVAEGDLERWYEYMLDTDRPGLDELLDRVADSLDLDRNTTIAFKHLAFGQHRRDLRAWLAGDSLPEAALARLDLSQDEGTDEEREHQARQVVVMLCRLAGNDLPILLSLDQVEALQTSAGDREGLFAFGQLVSTLHDETSNVLLVSCVQSAFATELKEHARLADYDRMTSLGARSLAPLTLSQAKHLIAARLTVADPSAMRPNVAGACWPLDEEELPRLVAPGDLTPRRLLAHCAERFDTLAARPLSVMSPAVRSIDTFLDEEWPSRVEQSIAANQPERTEDIVRHGLPLLLNLISPQWKLVRDEQMPDVALVFDKSSRRTGVTICTQRNMTSLAAKLRRLKSQFAPQRLARLVIIRDSRVPISKGAKVARQSLDELERQGAVIAHPTTEVLATLDALRGLLSDSKSGDLAHDGEAVGPRTVEDWLKTHLSDSLRSFADELVGVDSPTVDPLAAGWLDLEKLTALLADRPILSLDEVASLLGRPNAAVTATIQRHPDHIGLLNGPPAVVFRVTQNAE